MDMNQRVIVIGGGAIGVCTAFYLQEQGWKVDLLERGAICSGSSYGNAGMIVPSHIVPLAAPGVIARGLRWLLDPESPFYIKPRPSPALMEWLWHFGRACRKGSLRRALPVLRDLGLASRRLFDDLAERLAFPYEKKGMLMAFRTEKGWSEGVQEARLLERYGVQAQVLQPQEVQELAGGVSPAVQGGVYYPQDAHIVPHRFVETLAAHLKASGAGIHAETEVIGFRRSGRKVTAVETTRGSFTGEEVVLAGGSWSGVLGRHLGLRLPLQPAKGYSATYRCPAHCPPLPVFMAEAKVIMTPMGEAVRFAGTLELAGLDLSINRRRLRAVLQSVPAFLPGMDPKALDLLEIWRGLRPCSPDGLPFVGRPVACENVTVATGHATIGISLSPVTGKLVSQLLSGGVPLLDPAPLSPDRF